MDRLRPSLICWSFLADACFLRSLLEGRVRNLRRPMDDCCRFTVWLAPLPLAKKPRGLEMAGGCSREGVAGSTARRGVEVLVTAGSKYGFSSAGLDLCLLLLLLLFAILSFVPLFRDIRAVVVEQLTTWGPVSKDAAKDANPATEEKKRISNTELASSLDGYWNLALRKK